MNIGYFSIVKNSVESRKLFLYINIILLYVTISFEISFLMEILPLLNDLYFLSWLTSSLESLFNKDLMKLNLIGFLRPLTLTSSSLLFLRL